MIKNLLKKALFVLGIFAASQSFAQSTYTINVGDGGNLYVPANVTCLVGDTIKFVWISGFHPTQSLNGTTIPLVNMDGSGGVNSVYKIKMLTAGSVPYECTAHGGMGGVITVNAPFVPSTYVPFTGTGTLASNNWSTHSGTAGQLQTITTASDNGSSLAYTGMPTSTGNRTQIVAGNGEDVNRVVPIIPASAGSAYFSALIKLPNTTGQALNTSTGNYFMHFTDSSGTTGVTNHAARLTIRAGSAANTFNIGIINTSGGTASTAAQIFGASPVDYAINQTYLIVVKYTFATNTASLWVNPTISSVEPTPLISNNVGTNAALSKVKSICIRQAGTSTAGTGNIEIDEIRVTNNWNDALGVIPTPAVRFNPTSLTINENAGTATVTVNITNPNANPTSATVLVKGGTATGGSDYTFTSQTVTFPANSNTPQSFTFPITNDAAMEPDETIILALRNVTNSGSIGSDSILTITIPANDFAGAVVHFTSTSATVNENAGNAQMSVMVMGAGTTSPTSFDVVVKSGTATAGADYTYSTTTYTIPAAKDSTLVITVPVINDAAPEADETAVFAIRNITNSGTISTDSVFTLTIKNDDIAFKNISALRVNDVNGVSILKDSAVYIKGIVYGVDMQGSATSLQYTLIDPTGGVGIFRSGANNPPIISLVPEEGDSVKVYGKVGEFNGLTQVNMDSIILISKGNPLRAPRVVTRLDETTESNLVRFNNAQIIDTLANSASGTTLRIVSGTDSMDLRIDADVSLFGQPFPSQKFDVIGLGGQFDNSNPKNSGYQLLPRSINDIIAIVTPNAALDSASYSVSEGAGTKSIKIKLSSPANDPVSIKVTLTGGTATFTQDYNFTNPTVVNIPAGQSEGTFTFNIINDNTAEQNETINFSLSEATNCILTTPAGTLTILDNDGIGININKNIVANIYPNPTKDVVNVESTELINSIEIVNVIGQSIMTINQVQSNEKSVDVTALTPGVYNVIISTAKGNSIKRLVIE